MHVLSVRMIRIGYVTLYSIGPYDASKVNVNSKCLENVIIRDTVED